MSGVRATPIRGPAIRDEAAAKFESNKAATATKLRPAAVRNTVVVGKDATKSQWSTPVFQPVSSGLTIGLVRISAHNVA